MGLYSSLFVGVSGMQAQSNALSVISDNISNQGTVGYKQTRASFAELVGGYKAPAYSTQGVSMVGYAPGGVLPGSELLTMQGEVLPSASTTAIAVTGSGFIPVTNSPSSTELLFTRAGSFTQDLNGNFVNDNGFFLQAWPLDINGTLSAGLSGASVDGATGKASLQTVNVKGRTEDPVATTLVTIKANLDSTQAAYSGTPAYDPTLSTANMSSGAVPQNFQVLATAVDSKGTAHTLNLDFLKTANNSWAVEITTNPASDIASANPQLAAGTITFNGDGSLASVSPSLQTVPVSWSNGAAASSISFNWGTAGQPFGTPGATTIGGTDGMSQFASGYLTDYAKNNGIQPGILSGVTITADGFIQASYSNNTTLNLYQIPLANFADPNQLSTSTGDVFSQTTHSGALNFLLSGNGAGTISAGGLESSNVDLSTQLTSLIVAQNAYESNSKLVTTSDSLLQNLVQMGAT